VGARNRRTALWLGRTTAAMRGDGAALLLLPLGYLLRARGSEGERKQRENGRGERLGARHCPKWDARGRPSPAHGGHAALAAWRGLHFI